MIGCSFVVDREYFGEIGLLDPGMEVYGGENIELGMRVRGCFIPHWLTRVFNPTGRFHILSYYNQNLQNISLGIHVIPK